MNGKLPVWIAGEKERWSQKFRWKWKVKFWRHCWGIFMMIRMMCPCKYLIFMFFIYISEIFFRISIYSPLTLTNLNSPSFPRTKWKCIITIPQPRLQENTKQQYSYWQIHHAIWAYKLWISSSCSSAALSYELFVVSSLPCLSSPLDVVKPIKNL